MSERILKQALFARYRPYTGEEREQVGTDLAAALAACRHKVVVLDDDPTGVQTVHGVDVYTDWSQPHIDEGFAAQNRMFFLLTNSRSFTAAETQDVHAVIARRVANAARQSGSGFLLISRGDSTLRGHWPLETQTLGETLREEGFGPGAEILMPFFPEGGRYTAGDIHYVQQGDELVPAGETEFARDKTFGYTSSNLCAYIEEKTGGAYPASEVVAIPLEQLRERDYDGVCTALLAAGEGTKIIVNALEYTDVEVFAVGLLRALAAGKDFLFRTAAAFTRVIGGVAPRALLRHEELVEAGNTHGGLLVVGSHVAKTTAQLEALRAARTDGSLLFAEFDQHLVLDDAAFEAEIQRVIQLTGESIAAGQSVAVYTRRERFDLGAQDPEAELRIAVKISDALTRIVAELKERPRFIIAKGGITSSDIGTRGLRVQKARVLGQILPGIPVWQTGAESLFPGMPYIIFPGNVGSETALCEALETLQPQQKKVEKI